jgi:nitrogen fixation NifU-like protein
MDERDIYREEILEHYRHPQNFGALKKPDLSAFAANPVCGDEITLELKLKKDVVADVGFQGSGCALSIASASLTTQWMRGKKVSVLKKVTPEFLEKLFKAPVGPARLHCVHLPYVALRKVLEL